MSPLSGISKKETKEVSKGAVREETDTRDVQIVYQASNHRIINVKQHNSVFYKKMLNIQGECKNKETVRN